MGKYMNDGSELVTISNGTGGVLDLTATTPVGSAGVVVSGANGWSVPSAGFSNPMYFATDNADSTGFLVTDAASVIIAYEGTYSSYSITVEQTNDIAGISNWVATTFQNVSTVPGTVVFGAQTGVHAASGTVVHFPVTGVRMRIKATAMGSGTAIARVVKHGTSYPVLQTTVAVGGSVSDGANLSSANPVSVSGTYTTTPATLSTGQIGVLQLTEGKQLITEKHSSGGNGWSYAAASGGIVSSTTGITVKASAGAGLRNYVDSMQLSWNTLSALSELQIRDGASGTVLWRGIMPTVAGSMNIVFDKPLRGSAATLLEIAASASVTGGIFCNLQGHVAP